MGLLVDIAKERVLAVQDFTLLTTQALGNIFRSPHYGADIIRQMDFIGFGSLPIVVLTGFFTGAVLALQTASTLATFGETSLTGQLVMLSPGARVGASADVADGGGAEQLGDRVGAGVDGGEPTDRRHAGRWARTRARNS